MPSPSRAVRPSHRYTGVAIALHWLMALMILGSLAVGLTMARMEGLTPTRLQLYNWHKWAGVLILVLAALRLLWRLAHRPPALPPMPAWQHAAARFSHWSLYVMFFVVPLLGWAYSSSAGFPVVLFGVLPLPDWVSPDRELAETLKFWHSRAAWLLGVLVLVHIAAAWKHQLVDRDGLINRMLPARRSQRVKSTARLFSLLLLGIAGAASAAQLLPAASEIAFTTRQMGVPVEGRFTKFDAKLALDAKAPAGNSVAVSIETGSARFGSPELDAELPRETWFHTARFPQAVFESTSIKPAGPGRWDVAGALTIKGQRRELSFPVTLQRSNAGQLVASASVTIKRLDFTIGSGEWTDTSLLANDVQLRIKLVFAGVAALP